LKLNVFECVNVLCFPWSKVLNVVN
jgi:hypothetical protein